MTSKKLTIAAMALSTVLSSNAETVEKIKYGDMENWVTRVIKESSLLGGQTKTIYEIAPTRTVTDGSAYVPMGHSPWGTSNVMAKPVGITKTSCAVFPDTRENGSKCVKMTTLMEHCKAIGLINIDVLVAGSIFLGRMFEPVKDTKKPYSKMEMGIPFTRRPKALQFDYKLSVPNTNQRIYSSGFGSKKTLQGNDCAEAFIILQRRKEDSNGNIYANRVGTGRLHLTKSTNGWVNNFRIPVEYGDITNKPGFKPYMGLIPKDKSYYATNSKGKRVPVVEVAWDEPDATPTHMLVMFSAGSGEAYIGTLDLTLWVDNVALVFD